MERDLTKLLARFFQRVVRFQDLVDIRLSETIIPPHNIMVFIFWAYTRWATNTSYK